MIGPIGEFQIPETPENTREHVRALSQQVFDGEYGHPELPTAGIRRILDIGCGWGAFAVCAHAKWSEAEIIGYDPHGEALEYFRRNAPFASGILRAVTIDPAPFYGVSWEWGSGHTKGRSEGLRVPNMHPKDLGPCSLMKIDAEGVEGEILEHYRWLSELSILLVEWHSPELKAACDAIIVARSKLRCVQEQKDREYGVSIWVAS